MNSAKGRTSSGQHDRPPRRTLVTGGAGFIGSHLVHGLLGRGDHVTVVDDLSTGRRVNLPAQHPRLTCTFRSVDGSLADLGAACRFDEVYHLAAAVGVKLIVAKPIESIETNITQTGALLRWASEGASDGAGGARTPRVLIASSSEVYGKSSKVPFREDDDVTYGATTVARWSYAMSKAVDEYLALAYHAQRRLPVVIARFFNTVGPGQVGDYGMVLPRFIEKALRGEALEVYGDGEQSRCFCDVRDVAGVLPRLLASELAPGNIVNVGSEQPVTINQLAAGVNRIVGNAAGVRHISYAAAYGAGFEDLALRKPDTSKLRRMLDGGFSPAYALDRTIADTAAWVTNNKGSGADWTDEDTGDGAPIVLAVRGAGAGDPASPKTHPH